MVKENYKILQYKVYYPNNTLKYEGDFVNGGFEGNGKHIFPNGNYYIGNIKDQCKMVKVYYIIKMET